MIHIVTLTSGEKFPVETSCAGSSLVFFDMVMDMDNFRWRGQVIQPRKIQHVAPGPLSGLPTEPPECFPSIGRRSIPEFSEN